MTLEDTENIETHLYELFIMNHSFSVDNIAHIIWSWKIWMITVWANNKKNVIAEFGILSNLSTVYEIVEVSGYCKITGGLFLRRKSDKQETQVKNSNGPPFNLISV